MKDLHNRIQLMLEENRTYSRLVALITALSLLTVFLLPFLNVMPGAALTNEEAADIPEGSHEISAGDIADVTFKNVEGGTVTNDGHDIQVPAPGESVSFQMEVSFKIYDPEHDQIDANHPTIYLKVPKESINILSFGDNMTSYTEDNSDAWKDSPLNPNRNTSSAGKSGDLEIIPTGDNEYGYVKLTFTPGYLNYIKQGDFVNGSFKFNGNAARAATQDGDRDLNLGGIDVKVDFPDAELGLDKQAVGQSEDENGYPVLQWKIIVTDLYELDKYTIQDNMLSRAYDFHCTNDILRLENGQLVYEDKTNTVTPFEITYKTKVTPEELNAHTEAFDVTNEVHFAEKQGIKDSATFTITPDNDPKPVSKTGTADYYYTGSREGEDPKKHYVYWTAEVRRNYGASLAGAEIKDSTTKEGSETRISPELVEVYDINGTKLDKDAYLTPTNDGWTVKNGVTESYLKLVYRTEADNHSTYHNTISIGNRNLTPGPVEYDLDKVRTVSKTASPGYGSREEADGTFSEWVDWTITVDVTSKGSNNETINGYVIEDTAFVVGKYELLSAQIRTQGTNNNQTVNAGDILQTAGDNKLKIADTPVNMKYLTFTYRVPLTSDTPGLTGDRTANNGLGNDDCKLKNDYKVDDETGSVEIPVPGIGGRSTVNVSKNWNNGSDPDRNNENLKAAFQLQKQVVPPNGTLSDNGWTDVAGKTITVTGNSGSTTNAFTDLPEYEVGENNVRSKIYYRVVETMTIPDGKPNLYELQDNNTNNGATGSNVSISLTNVWQGVNFEGIKKWADDEGMENKRQNAVLMLEYSIDNGETWNDYTAADPLDFGTENDAHHTWQSLPKYDASHHEIQYRVKEPSVSDDYTSVRQDNHTIRNVYKNMTVSVHKNWDNLPEDRPTGGVTMTLYRSTDPNRPIEQWDQVEAKTLDNDQSDLQWTDLPKTNDSGQTFYYRVVETIPEDAKNEYTVSYSQQNVNKDSSSKTIQVDNKWTKRNLTVTKSWVNDSGHENKRPDVTFKLYRRLKNSTEDWTLYDNVELKNAQDGTGNFYAENSTDANTYTWHGLEKAYEYKVVEDHAEGYRTTYNGSADIPPVLYDENQSVAVTNTSDMMTIYVYKEWSGISGDDIPEMVVYRLYSSTDQETWTVFSDKVARKNADNSYQSASWTWMPKTDENGNQIYYRVEEVSVQRFETDGRIEVFNPNFIDSDGKGKNGVDDHGDVEFESSVETVTDPNTGNVNNVVTNTWLNMNVSVEKKWDTGLDSGEYQSVTMKLMKKVGESGAWEDAGKAPVTLTADDGWKMSDAWTRLPRFTPEGTAISYRAEEVSVKKKDGTELTVPSGWDFYTRPDLNGLKVSGNSVVTNTPKFITIGMNKVWGSFNFSSKPPKYTVYLEANVNGTWAKVSDLKTSMPEVFGNISDPVKELSSSSQNSFSWENLPTRYTDSSGDHEIIYRVSEEKGEGYTASYDKTEIRGNDTVTITNTENAPYTKQAAHSEKNDVIIPGPYNYSALREGASVDMSALKNGTLSPEELASIPVKVMEIDGEEVECYLFRWRVDLLTNQSQGSSTATTYQFTDTLNDGSVFVQNYDEYAVAWYDVNSSKYFIRGYKPSDNSYGGDDGNARNVVVEYPSPTSAVFKVLSGNVSVFSYFTATPKSVVDAALAKDGYYSLTNYIREQKEEDNGIPPKEAKLEVKSGDNSGYINKINKTGTVTGPAQGKIGAETIALYEVDVNKDGKYLSTGNTVTVSDLFRILDYTPYINNQLDEASKQSGRNVTLQPTIQNVRVYKYDNDGNLIPEPISENLYSYGVTKDTNGKYTADSIDYSTQFNNSNIDHNNHNALKITHTDAIPAGLEVIFKVNCESAQEGEKISLKSTSINSKVSYEFLNPTYDSSGAAYVKLKFNETVEANEQVGELEFAHGDPIVHNEYYTEPPKHTDVTSSAVQSAILTETMDTIDYVAKFTLPDGGHYKITYEYVIRDENGDKLNPGSNLTLQNDAIVHKSGGDQKDSTDKITYNVQEASGSTSIGSGLELRKVDIGNESLKDLTAEFIMASYSTSDFRWEYGKEFPFRMELNGQGNPIVDKNGNPVYSKTEHEMKYGEPAIVEISGNLPDNAGKLTVGEKFRISVQKNTLYKLVETKAPENRLYEKMPYENGNHSVNGNAANTYYFVYDTSSEKLAELRAAANLDSSIQIRSISSASSVLKLKNVQNISIGAEKIWEQDPEKTDVKVALQLFRNTIKSEENAVLVPNQESYIKDGNYNSDMQAYILKDSSKEDIWQGLPNGDAKTGNAYYYFVKETAYCIDGTWYTYNAAENKYLNVADEVWKDSAGNPAEYRPSYINDAVNENGVITVSNSRKLLVKKQWQDVNGNPLTDPPVSEIEYALYGIDKDGNETKLILPTGANVLHGPDWEMEIPQNLLSASFVRYRIEEVTTLEDFIVSDVYALNGSVGVIYLINKDSNPSSVNVTAAKTWADGNETHKGKDEVEFTLYRYTGSQTIDDAFINRFIENGKQMAGAALVASTASQPNPVTLNGMEAKPWTAQWNDLPFKLENKKIQYFIVETMSAAAAGKGYAASYTIDGNTRYLGNRTMDVTNAQPGSLIVKKQWRDKDTGELLSNVNYADIQLRLYRKALADVVTPADNADLTKMESYGLHEGDVVTGYTNIDGLSSDGIITLNKDNAWTVSLLGLDTGFKYYIEEIADPAYPVTIEALEYTNQAQEPGSRKILTVTNSVAGRTIGIEVHKTWVRNDGKQALPESITYVLEQNNADESGEWIEYDHSTATAANNYHAEWSEVPADKSYRVREEAVNGWTAEVTEETPETEDGEVIKRIFTVTNTLQQGSLELDKKWYQNDSGSTKSVNVKVYRIAYDEGGSPIYERDQNPAELTDAQRTAMANFSTGDKLYSMNTVRTRLRQINARSRSNVVQQAAGQTYASTPAQQKPRTISKAGIGVNLKAVGTDSNGSYISLKNVTVGANPLNSVLQEIGSQQVYNVYAVVGSGGYYNGRIRFDNIWNFPGNVAIDDSFKTGDVIEIGTPSSIPSTIYIEVYDTTHTTATISEIRFYTSLPQPAGPTVTITESDMTKTAGDTGITLHAATDPDGLSITWSSDNPEAVTVDSQTGEISCVGVGEANITATASNNGNDGSDSIKITVGEFKIQNKPLTLTEGQDPITLSTNATSGDVTWSSDNDAVQINPNTGEITSVGYSDQQVKITATHGGVTDWVTVSILPKDLALTINDAQAVNLHIGDQATLTATPSDGLSGWMIEGDSGVIEVTGNTVKALQDGTAAIKVQRYGKTSNTVTVNVGTLSLAAEKTELSRGEKVTINVQNAVDGIESYVSSDESKLRIVSVEGSTIVAEALDAADTAVTITVTDGAGETAAAEFTVSIDKAAVSLPQELLGENKDRFWSETVSLQETNEWKAALDNLPLTDGQGHTYQYYVEEMVGDQAVYYPIFYSESGGFTLEDQKTKVVTIENKTEQREEPVELPESGSSGTKNFFVTGGVMLLLTAAGYTMYKRRRWSDE